MVPRTPELRVRINKYHMITTLFLQTSTTQISIFTGKIELGNTLYKSSFLLNLTVTVTESHKVLLLLSALHL